MPIKAIVTKLEDAPEALRSLYRPTKGEDEPTGAFILDVEGVNGVELRPFTKLLNALQEERGAAETATKKLRKYEELGPAAEIERKLASASETEKKLAELSALDPKREADKLAEAKVQAIVGDLTKKHQDELAKLADSNKGLKGQIETLLIDSEAKSALAAAGVMPGADTLLLGAIRQVARVVEKDGKSVLEIVDPTGTARIKDAERTPFGISDLVAELAKSHAYAFKATDGSGAGAPPGNSNGGAPAGGKKPSEMSPTEKAKIISEKGIDAFQAMLKAEHSQAA